MSKHEATPTKFSLEAERFAAQMARTYGRRTPLPGNGRRRNNVMQVQA
jgi:hypothetical protein